MAFVSRTFSSFINVPLGFKIEDRKASIEGFYVQDEKIGFETGPLLFSSPLQLKNILLNNYDQKLFIQELNYDKIELEDYKSDKITILDRDYNGKIILSLGRMDADGGDNGPILENRESTGPKPENGESTRPKPEGDDDSDNYYDNSDYEYDEE